MLQSVVGTSQIERTAFDALESSAYSPMPRHGQITPMSSLLAQALDTAGRGWPKHLESLHTLINDADGTGSRFRDVRIEFPAHKVSRPSLPDYAVTSGLAGLLKLPLKLYAHQDSPVLQDGVRTSYALRTDEKGPWMDKGHTLLMHVDHREGVARALTLVDHTAVKLPVRYLLDTGTPKQRTPGPGGDRLSTLPAEILLQITEDLPAGTAGALACTSKPMNAFLKEANAARAAMAQLPSWLKEVCMGPKGAQGEDFSALEALVGGPYEALLRRALADYRASAVEVMKVAARDFQPPAGAALQAMDARLEQVCAGCPALLADYLRVLRSEL